MEIATWEQALNAELESGQLAKGVNGTDGSWVQPETKRIMYTLAGGLRRVLKDGDGPVKDAQIKPSCWQGESCDKDVCTLIGSLRNGFGTCASDLDINLQVPCNDTLNPVKEIKAIFEQLVDLMQKKGLFTNITRIFGPYVPVLKLTDLRSQIEVDVCFNNYLAVVNTKLLLTYHDIDERVGLVGRLVKEWAKKHELVGTADGFLNSYAFMLLVIQFLMTRKPAILPNLQLLADEPNIVQDSKWGFKQDCETKFLEDAEAARDSLHKSNGEKFGQEVNNESPYELLLKFFEFYGSRRGVEKMWADEPDKEEKLEKWDSEHPHVFNWSKHAVCIRLYEPGQPLLCKVSSKGEPNREFRRLMWSNLPYIEDPFDLFHNLGEKCLDAPRNHMLDRMVEAYEALKLPYSSEVYLRVFPQARSDCFLKFRVNPAIHKQDALDRFKVHNPRQIYWPRSGSGFAYIMFPDSKSRRVGHAENQSQINGQSLNLHYSTEFSMKQEQDTLEELIAHPLVPQQPVRQLEQATAVDPLRMPVFGKAPSKAGPPAKSGAPAPQRILRVDPKAAMQGGGAPGLQQTTDAALRPSMPFPSFWQAPPQAGKPDGVQENTETLTLASRIEICPEAVAQLRSSAAFQSLLEQARCLLDQTVLLRPLQQAPPSTSNQATTGTPEAASATMAPSQPVAGQTCPWGIQAAAVERASSMDQEADLSDEHVEIRQ
mmetsp:Transcript_49304/g.90953  ORF Transcript_49304/g.90953 Transcript_49304/m.90953 type:complete len:712 (-) Transcript_49304:258-2393(-)